MSNVSNYDDKVLRLLVLKVSNTSHECGRVGPEDEEAYRELLDKANASDETLLAYVRGLVGFKSPAALPCADKAPKAEIVADLHSTMDAKVWADEFCRLNNAADHGTMLAWFANAIMVGYDHAKREVRPAA